MTTMRQRLGRWQFLLGGGTLLVGGLFAACSPGEGRREGPSEGPRGTELPKLSADCPRGKAPQTKVELDACLGGFDFDSDSYAGDEQPLAVIGTPPGPPCPGDPKHEHTCRYGPLAKIEPLKVAHRYSESDLRQGRIIARISIPKGEKEGYPKYGLQPGGVTYWWVQTDSTGRRGTSVYLTPTADGKFGTVKRPLIRELYDKSERVLQAIARWIWSLEDETSQGHCGAATCK